MARQSHPYRKVALGLLLLFLGLWSKLLLPVMLGCAVWGVVRLPSFSTNAVEMALIGLFVLDIGGRFLCFWAPAEPPSILWISATVVIDLFVLIVLLLSYWMPLFGFLERLKPSVPAWAAPFFSQWVALAVLQFSGYVVFLLFLVWLAGHLHQQALVSLARWVFGIFAALIVTAVTWVITFANHGLPGLATAFLIVRVELAACGLLAVVAIVFFSRLSIVLRGLLVLAVLLGLLGVFSDSAVVLIVLMLILLLLFLYSGLLFALRAALQDALYRRFEKAA